MQRAPPNKRLKLPGESSRALRPELKRDALGGCRARCSAIQRMAAPIPSNRYLAPGRCLKLA